MQKFVIFVALLAAGVAADYKTYKGYQVWEVTPKTTDEFDVLKEWEVVPGVDYGDSLSRRGTSKVIVAPEVQQQYETFLTLNRIAHEVVIADLER
jgi:Carboxypeptidase activation peptide